METIGDDNYIALDGYKKPSTDIGGAAKILYPRNLFVIGTVNIDETTYMFSPKVLDRANVNEFKPDRDDVLRWFEEREDVHDVSHAEHGVAQSFLRLAIDIREDVDYAEATDIAKAAKAFGALYDALEAHGFEFAYRTVHEVRRYINAAHELSDEGLDIDAVIDEQIVQKVLPKIYGNKREIGELMDQLLEICAGNLSSAKIQQMKKRLINVQYASFI